MESIEKKVRITRLFNLYGYFLSTTQQEIMHDYYFMDLSLSEISENRSISRAAVEDAIKKGINKLETYDNDLHLLEKQDKIYAKLQDLSENLNNCEDINELKSLMDDLNYGI